MAADKSNTKFYFTSVLVAAVIFYLGWHQKIELTRSCDDGSVAFATYPEGFISRMVFSGEITVKGKNSEKVVNLTRIPEKEWRELDSLQEHERMLKMMDHMEKACTNISG
ncbi:MAG: hypothetical protein OEY52_02930 [Gammaproteobacteria bacterium]|nr:hypothetical protein [Gammaproteobacteria bacterium]